MSRDCPKGNCVIEKIKEFSAVLADVELPLKRRKIALKYLVHYLWDGGLIDWKKESLLKYATRLNAQLQDLEKTKWLHSKVNDWADES